MTVTSRIVVAFSTRRSVGPEGVPMPSNEVRVID
jgi:hypothetical protein